MKDLKAIKGRYYIRGLIEEGEHVHQDFKFAISDARKIARSLSAFANNDGGRLLVGVKDNGAIAGVRNEEDIYVIEQAAQMYCEPAQEIDVTAFACGEGAVVFRVEIQKATRRPVVVKEADGRRRAYFRVRDENIAADPLMVRAWRAAAADRPCDTALRLGGPVEILLRLADDPAGTTTEAFMREAHVSRAAAEETVVRLFALSLLEFRYADDRFRLFRKSPE